MPTCLPELLIRQQLYILHLRLQLDGQLTRSGNLCAGQLLGLFDRPVPKWLGLLSLQAVLSKVYE